MRGKWRRFVEPKRASGEIECPPEIHEQYMKKGGDRDKLWEAFVKCGGDKDCPDS